MILDFDNKPIFQIKIGSYMLDLDHEEISKHCVAMVNKVNELNPNPKTARNRVRTTYHDNELNNEFIRGMPERTLFAQMINHCAHTYIHATGRDHDKKGMDRYKNPTLHYWASVYEEGDQHSSHIHNGSFLSGTYYPQTDKHSEHIVFENPMIPVYCNDLLPPEESYHRIRPQTGQLLIWPSWLPHHVPIISRREKKRIAISFNISYK